MHPLYLLLSGITISPLPPLFGRAHQQGDASPDQQPTEPQPPAEGRRAALQEEAPRDPDGDKQGRSEPLISQGKPPLTPSSPSAGRRGVEGLA